jgi:erythronate-4-phosphate dehydrogenase
VVDYVLSALAAIEGGLEQALAGTVGIIGLGNVGGCLYRRLTALGVRCIGHDPLLQGSHNYQVASLDEVLACEVVCCHAPLTRSGPFPSWHMLDQKALEQLPEGGILLNAGRGAVIDNHALLSVLANRPDLQVVLDVWEGEPCIERRLLPLVKLATPHIAGYSFDGKLAGTQMIYQAVCQHFGLAQGRLVRPEPNAPISVVRQNMALDQLREAIWQVYDVRKDDQRFRVAMACTSAEQAAKHFDQLRKNYPERREFSAKPITGFAGTSIALNYLRAVGFEVNG